MFLERRITRRKNSRNAVNKGFLSHIHINVTIRRTLGNDVNAACGQLRKTHIDNLKSL